MNNEEPSLANGSESYEIKYLIKNRPQKVIAHVIGLPADTFAGTGVSEKKAIEALKSQVKLKDDGKFTQDIKRMLDYILSFQTDSLLFNFRAAAGLPTGQAKPMSGWDAPESNLRGHTTGHYLSATALAYEITHDNRLRRQADEIINALDEVQRTYTKISEAYAGYLSAYPIEQLIGLEAGEKYPAIWAPYYTLHKIMAGLLDCYRVFKNNTALCIVRQMGLWIYRRLSKLTKQQLNKMWSVYIAGEFGGINETLAELYLLTGEEKFLITAKLFDNDTLFYPMSINMDTLGGLHANQHIPQIIGALKLFEATKKPELFDVASNFWEMVYEHHIYAIGGIGNTEMFHNPDCISKELSEKNAESCCSYNMLKLTRMLFEYDPSSKYADYYERVLLNHILSVSCPQYGGTTMYFTGMQPGARKNYQTPENTCCHGTGLESKFRYNEGIYYISSDEIYINLFINSVLNIENSFMINLTVKNKGRNQICIKIEQSDQKQHTLKIRIPAWCNGVFEILHSKGTDNIKTEDNYIAIRKNWKTGDYIHVKFSSPLRLEYPKDSKNLFSIFYGPLILALLDEAEDYITFDQSQEELIGCIKQTDELTFKLNGYELKPLYQVVDEKYHIYMKHNDKEYPNE